MIILVLANEKESDKPFWKLIFLNEEDERPKYHLYYRKDGVKEIETTRPKHNILGFYNDFSKLPGEYYYDEKNKEITNCNNSKTIDLNELTYNNDEYYKLTNTIWILESLEKSSAYFRLFLISEIDPSIVEKNIEIELSCSTGNCFDLSLINLGLCDNIVLDTLKRNKIILSNNTSIVGLPIRKAINLYTGKITEFDKENFDNLNKYIEIINFTGEYDPETIKEYNELKEERGNKRKIRCS